MPIETTWMNYYPNLKKIDPQKSTVLESEEDL